MLLAEAVFLVLTDPLYWCFQLWKVRLSWQCLFRCLRDSATGRKLHPVPTFEWEHGCEIHNSHVRRRSYGLLFMVPGCYWDWLMLLYKWTVTIITFTHLGTYILQWLSRVNVCKGHAMYNQTKRKSWKGNTASVCHSGSTRWNSALLRHRGTTLEMEALFSDRRTISWKPVLIGDASTIPWLCHRAMNRSTIQCPMSYKTCCEDVISTAIARFKLGFVTAACLVSPSRMLIAVYKT